MRVEKLSHKNYLLSHVVSQWESSLNETDLCEVHFKIYSQICSPSFFKKIFGYLFFSKSKTMEITKSRKEKTEKEKQKIILNS